MGRGSGRLLLTECADTGRASRNEELEYFRAGQTKKKKEKEQSGQPYRAACQAVRDFISWASSWLEPPHPTFPTSGALPWGQ